MNFEEWNELIAKELFNESKRGQNVLLCLTEEDIINVYKQKTSSNKDNRDIWNDFCRAIKEGTSRGYLRSFVDKLKDAIEQTNDDKPDYPYYISYLMFLTLPLVEDNSDEKFKTTAYYPKLEKFLQENFGGNFDLGRKDFSYIVTPCWKKLEEWANRIKRGKLGFFHNVIREGNREHVDRIFSQVILTPTLRKRLPNIFEKRRPYFENSILFQNQFDFLKIPKNADLLWNHARDLILSEYRDYRNREPIFCKKTKTGTIAKPSQQLLQIDINRNDGTCEFYCREKQADEYTDKRKIPEDFVFSKPTYFFIPCYCVSLSGGLIETNKLLSKEQMYLLCKDNKTESYKKCFTDFEQISLSNIPEGYFLFKIFGIKQNIDGLEINENKSIEFFDGLKIEARTFAFDYLPNIKICNGDISDKVYIEIENKKNYLNKIEDYWELPKKDIPINTEFKVKIENEKINNDEFNYVINYPAKVCLELNNYIDATILEENDKLREDTRIRGRKNTTISYDSPVELIHGDADYFISYLSLLKKMPVEKFDKIFSFFRGYYDETERKTTINLLSSLCFIDYDYKTGYIDTLAPEFILIPALENASRSALLIGCRDIIFVEEIIKKSPKYNLKIIIKSQHKDNEKYLLPSAIIINAFGNEKNNYGEDDIAKFAEDIEIPFKDKDFLFIKILEQQCNKLTDYENEIKQKPSTNNFSDFTPYIFNPQTLRFEESEDSKIDRTLSLVEYKIREWEYYYIFWHNKISYEVDKSLGRYLFLWKKSIKHIIFRNNSPFGIVNNKKEKFAVPMKCPLPKHINRNLMLMSGLAPLEHLEKSLHRKFYIYDEIPNGNLFKEKLCQNPQENTIWIP